MKTKDYLFAVITALFFTVVIYGNSANKWPSAAFFIACLCIGGLAVLLWVLLRIENLLYPAEVPCTACGAMIRRGAKFCGSCGTVSPARSFITAVLDIVFFRRAK
jgi:hypothetical protein